MIYIHIPFCKSFCTYCGFYSEVCSDKVQNLFMSSLLEEIESRREEINAATQAPHTLYFGGGTPSLLPLPYVKRIVDALDCGPYEEFTFEVNPEDIVSKGEDYVRGLMDIGVNRISMGVQSLDDNVLKWMNRRHDADKAREAYGILRGCGVDNISLDLIFGLPDYGRWEESLKEIISLRPEHISAYQLSVEPDSALEKLKDDGRWQEASQEECRTAYDTLCREMADAGYRHYEISNFALPGREAIHNSAYWRRLPYTGLGPAAHSFDGRRRFWNSEDTSGWTSSSEILSDEDSKVEEIMLALRTGEGLPVHRAAELCSGSTLADLVRSGELVVSEGRYRIPESEFFVSDDIIRKLI